MSKATIKEHPILFSREMVRAILDRGKSQTRRLFVLATGHQIRTRSTSPEAKYGRPGERLWVREAWAFLPSQPPKVVYRADRKDPSKPAFQGSRDGLIEPVSWKPSIHMPREFCRLELDIVATRIEPLQDLTEEDAIAEGVYETSHGWSWAGTPGSSFDSPIRAYCNLWDRINPDSPWESNPSVIVITSLKQEVAHG